MIFAILRFPGSTKFVLSGDPLFLNMEGMDLFVKILVYVKILSQCTRKEGRKEGGRILILRSARGKLNALKNVCVESVVST